MIGVVTPCFTFALLQVAVGRAQSNEQATLHSPSISELQTTEKSLQINTPTFSSSGVTDFLNENTAPAPIIPPTGTTTIPVYSSSSSGDLLNYAAAPTPTTQPASGVNIASHTPIGGIDSSTYTNPAPTPLTPTMGAETIPYTSPSATGFLNYGNAVPAPAPTTPLFNSANTQAYTSSVANGFLNNANTAPIQTTPLTNAVNPAAYNQNYANTAPIQTTPLTNAVNPAAYNQNYANTAPIQTTPLTNAVNPAAYNQNYANTAPASFTPQFNGYGYPAYSNFPNFAALPPHYASMAGQSQPYPSPYANQLAYGNMQYIPSPYFPQFPMGYMTPQLPYGMIPNPAQYAPFPPQARNFNQTQYNNSLARYPSPLPPQLPVDTPAAGTQDQSLPTVVSSTGENGADLNSLPPQVKEFIDMIPQILDMQESSPQQPSPQHSIKPSPLRKYPKYPTNSLFKKKQHYPTYPLYPNHPQRYGYYY